MNEIRIFVICNKKKKKKFISITHYKARGISVDTYIILFHETLYTLQLTQNLYITLCRCFTPFFSDLASSNFRDIFALSFFHVSEFDLIGIRTNAYGFNIICVCYDYTKGL